MLKFQGKSSLKAHFVVVLPVRSAFVARRGYIPLTGTEVDPRICCCHPLVSCGEDSTLLVQAQLSQEKQ